MLRSARFALIVGLAAAIPVVSQQQNKQETKGDSNKKKAEPSKAEPSKKDSAAKDAKGKESDERISRMKERNREIDRMLNDKQKR